MKASEIVSELSIAWKTDFFRIERPTASHHIKKNAQDEVSQFLFYHKEVKIIINEYARLIRSRGIYT